MTQKLQNVEGKISRCIYQNMRNPLAPYSIYEVSVTNANFELTQQKIPVIIHSAPPEEADITYRFFGQLTEHPLHGYRFECEAFIRPIPIDIHHTIEFLSSDIFKGIGRKRAEKIVEEIGEDCLMKIMIDPNILNDIGGIPEETIHTIQENILENISLQPIILKLNDWQISLKLAKKIYKVYGDTAIKKIEENPYILANNISGISFIKSDNIAKNLNIKDDDEVRIKGAIEYALNNIYHKLGSTWASEEYVLTKTIEIFYEVDKRYISKEIVKKHLDDMIKMDIKDKQEFVSDLGQVRKVGERIYLERYFLYEKYIAETLISLNKVINKQNIDMDAFNAFFNAFMETKAYFKINDNGFVFSTEQEDFIIKAYTNNVVALTGGPGTGKSTIIKAILMIYYKLNSDLPFEEFQDRVKLLAPTGRAAKRMFELTQLNATTMHNFLLNDQHSFNVVAEDSDENINLEVLEQLLESKEIRTNNTRPNRLFIIDEMSMVDISLMKSFLEKTKTGDRIILVGDVNQLPSVKAGNVFGDIISSNRIDTVILNKVYRQGDNSSILSLAKNIQEGITEPKDILVETEEVKWRHVKKDDILITLREQIELLLSKGILFNDIQIICPVHRGEQGITAINDYMQRLMLVDAFDIGADFQFTNLSNEKSQFYVGDSVIQLKNNSKKQLSNGDLGVVIGHIPANEADDEKDRLIVRFKHHEVQYLESELDEIDLAYAFSVHKAQGSEFPHILLPMSEYFAGMMNRNFLYTAVTRAKESISIIGNAEVFIQSINKKPLYRYTFLRGFLKNGTKF